MVSLEKIIETAKKEKVDVIGLSGLITPSLDEMVYVAEEMQRQGLDIPLLIGGATTSRIHTAVKIAPKYKHPVIHVLDASRSVPVVSNLLNPKLKDNFIKEIRQEYDEMREGHARRKQDKNFVTIAKAREQKFQINWENANITKPNFLGQKTLLEYDLAELREFIDWTPFFQSWELHGKYPKILTDEVVGKEATKLFADANALLDKIISEKLFTAKATFGFFPANSTNDDDIAIYDFKEEITEVPCDKHGSHKHAQFTENREKTIAHIRTLRQQSEKANNQPYIALADFIAPNTTQKNDYIGGFAVAIFGAEELAQQFEKQLDDYQAIMSKALADRFAEAFAERLHQRVRKEFWGYDQSETLANEDLIREKYKGIRPAPGYPACPDHSEKITLFDLLNVKENTGIFLTENLAMYPAAAVSGWYFANEESKYFGLGKIEKDQMEDLIQRKGVTLKDAEKWLKPNLNYE